MHQFGFGGLMNEPPMKELLTKFYGEVNAIHTFA